MWHKPEYKETEPALGNLAKVRLGKRGKIIVGVVGQPPAYHRDSGPPLAPITLLPPHDSTAYIIDKFEHWIPDNNGKIQHKRLKYLIGWTDLPAARLALAANDVLDYVSPAALEEWEYRQSLERDEDERQKAKRNTHRHISKHAAHRKRKLNTGNSKPVVTEAEPYPSLGRPLPEASQRQLRPRQSQLRLLEMAAVEPGFNEPAAKRRAVGGSISEAFIPKSFDEKEEEEEEEEGVDDSA